MFSKRSVIVLLVGLNLLLVAGLIFSVSSLPPAFAQSAARGGGFVSVTAKAASRLYDVLYVVDTKDHKLYAFYPSGGVGSNLAWSEPRDLRQDFETD